MASTIVVDREGVECEKLHALQVKDNSGVETAMKATMHYEFDAFGANLQCCLSLLSGSCEFFFFLKATSIKSWTVLEPGLSSQKLRTFRRNLLGADSESWSQWRFSKT